MSDYYGAATLEDWLLFEHLNVTVQSDDGEFDTLFDDKVPVCTGIVKYFEQWRQPIEDNIAGWMDSDKGDGKASWRGWGRGYVGIPEEDLVKFQALTTIANDWIQKCLRLTKEYPEYATIVHNDMMVDPYSIAEVLKHKKFIRELETEE